MELFISAVIVVVVVAIWEFYYNKQQKKHSKIDYIEELHKIAEKCYKQKIINVSQYEQIKTICDEQSLSILCSNNELDLSLQTQESIPQIPAKEPSPILVPDSIPEKEVALSNDPSLVPDSIPEKEVALSNDPSLVPDSIPEKEVALPESVPDLVLVSDSTSEKEVATPEKNEAHLILESDLLPENETAQDSISELESDSRLVPDLILESDLLPENETAQDSISELESDSRLVPDLTPEKEVALPSGSSLVPDSTPEKETALVEKKTARDLELVPDSTPEKETALVEKKMATFEKETAQTKVSVRQSQRETAVSKYSHFKDNILLFLGLFLIMAGEVFLVAHFWADLSGAMQMYGSYLLVFSSSVFFFFIGDLTVKKLHVEKGGLFLYLLSLLLIPCTFAVMCYISSLTWQVALFVTTFSIFWMMGRRVGYFVDKDNGPRIVGGFIVVSAMQLVLPILGVVAAYGAVAIYAYLFWKMRNTSFALVVVSLLLSFVAIFSVLGHWFYIGNVAFFVCAPLLCLYAYFPFILDRFAFRLRLPVLPLFGLLLCVLGLTISTAHPQVLFYCVCSSCVFVSLYTHVFRKQYLFFIALVLSGVAYLLLPSIAPEISRSVHHWLSAQFGYEQLPTSYSALAFVPYLVAVCFLGKFIRNMLLPVQLWFALVSVGLLCLVKLSDGDFAVAMISLPLYVTLYMLSAKLLRLPFAEYLIFIAVSIWGYDVINYCVNGSAVGIYSLLSIAILWLLLAVIVPIKRYVTCLLDVYTLVVFFCAFAQIQNVNFGSFYHSTGFILNGILISVCVLIYQNKWLWIPSFAISSFGVYVCVDSLPHGVHHAYNFAYAFAIWGYVLAFMGGIIKFTDTKLQWFQNRVVRFSHRISNEVLTRPLLYLIPIPLLASFAILVFEEAFLQPNLGVMITFFSMSILLLSIPAIFNFSVNLTWLAQLLFVFFALPACINLWWYGLVAFCLGSVLFVCISFVLQNIPCLYLGSVGIIYSAYCFMLYLNITYEAMLIVAISLALLYAVLCFFVKEKRSNHCFQVYSFAMGAVSLAGMSTLLVQNFHSSIALIITAFATTIWAFLHYLRHRENGVVFIFFLCIALAITLSCEYFFPKMWQIHAWGLACCSFVWWRLQRLLLVPVKSFVIYSAILTAVIYGLCCVVIFGSWQLNITAFFALGLITAYASVLAFRMHSNMFVWIFAFLIHQMAFVMLIFNNIITFEHTLSYFVSAIFFVLWIARHYKHPQLYTYSLTMLSVVTTATILARFHFVDNFSRWTLTSYLPTLLCSISYVYIYLCTQRKLALSLSFVSGGICAVLLVDYLQYPFIYYGVAFSYLTLLYTILPLKKISQSSLANYASNCMAIIASGIFAYFYIRGYNNYWLLYRYHIVLAGGLSILWLTFVIRLIYSQQRFLSYVCVGYFYAILFCCVAKIYFAQQWYLLIFITASWGMLVVMQIFCRKLQMAISSLVDTSLAILSLFLFLYIAPLVNFPTFLDVAFMWTSIAAWTFSGYLLYTTKTPWRINIAASFCAVIGGIICHDYAVITSLLTKNYVYPCSDWALYGSFCIVFGHYMHKKLYCYWGMLFTFMSVLAALSSAAQLASIFAVFLCSCTLLFAFVVYGKYYYRFGTFALLFVACGLFAYHVPQQMSPQVDFSMWAIVFAGISCCFAITKRNKNTYDGVYFCTVITLTLLLTLSLGSDCTAMMVITGVLSLLLCSSACFRIGSRQTSLYGYYAGLFLFAMAHVFVAFNSAWLDWVKPDVYFFVSLALLPAILTIFIRQTRLQCAIGNFSLFVAMCVLLWVVTTTYSVQFLATYIIYLAAIALVANIYVPKTTQHYFSQQNIQGFAGVLSFTAALISVYTVTVTDDLKWLCYTSGILAISFSINYIRNRSEKSLYYTQGSFVISMLLLLHEWFALEIVWFPLVTISLLSTLLFIPQHISRTYRTLVRVSAILLEHTIYIVVTCGIVMFTTAGTDVATQLFVTKYRFLWLSTGIIAALAIKISQYRLQRGSPLLLVVSTMVCAALSTPVAYFFPAIENLPSVEWLVVACLLYLSPTTRFHSFYCLWISLLSTEFDYTKMATFICFASATVYFTTHTLRSDRQTQKTWLPISIIGFVCSLYVLVLYFYAQNRVQMWDFLALSTAFASIVIFAIHKYLHAENRSLLIQASMLLSILAALEILQVWWEQPPILALTCLTCSSFVLGNKTQRSFFYYCAQVLVVALYFSLQYYTQWLHFLHGYDPHVLLILSITFLHIGLLTDKKELRAFRVFAGILPLAIFFYEPWRLGINACVLYVLMATHFALMYRGERRTWQLVTSLVFLDIALYHYWQLKMIVDPQFYGVPLGITLLGISEFHRNDISKKQLFAMRVSGMTLIYGSSLIQVFLQLQNPTYALVLGGIAFLGVMIGFVLNKSFYMYFASAVLVVDILVYIIKFGVDHGILQGLLLVLAGIIVLGSAIVSQFKKNKNNTTDLS